MASARLEEGLLTEDGVDLIDALVSRSALKLHQAQTKLVRAAAALGTPEPVGRNEL